MMRKKNKLGKIQRFFDSLGILYKEPSYGKFENQTTKLAYDNNYDLNLQASIAFKEMSWICKLKY